MCTHLVDSGPGADLVIPLDDPEKLNNFMRFLSFLIKILTVVTLVELLTELSLSFCLTGMYIHCSVDNILEWVTEIELTMKRKIETLHVNVH